MKETLETITSCITANNSDSCTGEICPLYENCMKELNQYQQLELNYEPKNE